MWFLIQFSIMKNEHVASRKALVFVILTIATNFINSLIIAPPTSKDDYQDLASLLVESFDEPSIVNTISKRGGGKEEDKYKKEKKSRYYNDDDPILESTKLLVERFQWILYDKFFTEQFTVQQYMQTALKMKGKKYSIYLAKEYNPGLSNDGSEARPFYEIIGMIEFGMILEPTRIKKEFENAKSNNNEDTATTSVIHTSVGLKSRATIGILCVKSNFMSKGVGKALLTKCEDEVKKVWNETQLFTEVEPDNVRALRFFESCGYGIEFDDDGNEILHYANVSRKRRVEERLHYVLNKTIII